MGKDSKTVEEALIYWGGKEVTPMEVYSDIFSLGYGVVQKNGEPSGKLKSNPLVYYKNNSEKKGRYRILFEDDFEEMLKKAQDADFAIINGLTYFGRKNYQANAHKMYAMIFDIDDVGVREINNFLSPALNADWVYPLPNYIVLSGTGVHLYYLLEYGVPLYPNIKLQLKNLKYALIDILWNRNTSQREKKQFQGINQGFRVIGGRTKTGEIVKAYKFNTTPFNLDELGKYVNEKYRVDENQLFKENKYTMIEAKEKFPEWYQKRIVNQEPRGSWKAKRDLYDWWKKKIEEEARGGHRYFCIMCLAIYATKSGIPFEELKKDAYDLIPAMNDIGYDHDLTEEDVDSALECYDERYITFPRFDIEKISGITIPPNKRNKRKQKEHIRVMSAIRDIDHPDGSWRKNSGRPNKEQMVSEFIKDNPNMSVAAMARELGVSRPTIYKYKKPADDN